MRAILLAAGVGERLRPLTERTPKCLVPLAGRTLLDHWFALLARHGVREVLLNTHHLAERVEEHVRRVRPTLALDVRTVHEPELRGTGGTLVDQLDFVRDEEAFFVAHADNYTDLDLTAFREFHEARGSVLSIALFRAREPERCGIVSGLAPDGCILEFEEKPRRPRTNLASAAAFLLAPSVITDLPRDRPFDFSREVLPRYQGLMYGWEMAGFNVDVGTPKSLVVARRLAEGRAQREAALEGAVE